MQATNLTRSAEFRNGNSGALTRRDILRGAIVAAAAAALPDVAFTAEADAAGALLTRPIPSTGERLPIVGLGTNA